MAELHNLGMLKKHMLKVHLSGDGAGGGGGRRLRREQKEKRQRWLSCEWEACQCPHVMSLHDLRVHIMKEHVEPLAWMLGDGPYVPETGERLVDPICYNVQVTYGLG